MSKTIYLARHCEGFHNLRNDDHLPDPRLTDKGKEQCRELHKLTQNTLQQEVDMIVCSPLRRTMETCLIAFETAVQRLGKDKVIVLPQLQEINGHPNDICTPLEEISADPVFEGLDFSNLAASPDYRDKSSPESFYSTAVPAIKARAKWVRTWLRYSTGDAQKIVVVCHGDLIRFLTLGSMATGLFGHGEIRSYIFSPRDPENWLVQQDVEVKLNYAKQRTAGELAKRRYS